MPVNEDKVYMDAMIGRETVNVFVVVLAIFAVLGAVAIAVCVFCKNSCMRFFGIRKRRRRTRIPQDDLPTAIPSTSSGIGAEVPRREEEERGEEDDEGQKEWAIEVDVPQSENLLQ
ncbi:uncharacterized protein LOC143026171 [Oratosquilla oratoria]|uniref:uncharacterized protein LOC143026171 n=1 Tax=Oratosquilla oratoria TaxID=337810 RepID=UPI003F773B55